MRSGSSFQGQSTCFVGRLIQSCSDSLPDAGHNIPSYMHDYTKPQQEPHVLGEIDVSYLGGPCRYVVEVLYSDDDLTISMTIVYYSEGCHPYK